VLLVSVEVDPVVLEVDVVVSAAGPSGPAVPALAK
jgi:ribulose 1,5-bisphosphate synthetase/thiazole synthase